MANIAHEPVKKAMSRIRELSADEEARRLAFVRERALRDEVSFLNQAKREGRQEGLQEGREEIARNMILKTDMDDLAIADIASLSVDDIARLRADMKH